MFRDNYGKTGNGNQKGGNRDRGVGKGEGSAEGGGGQVPPYIFKLIELVRKSVLRSPLPPPSILRH